MKETRYTEEQIDYALRLAELGTPVTEVVRKMGVSEQTFCRLCWPHVIAHTEPGRPTISARSEQNP